MTQPSTALMYPQIGVETTPGTAVAATIRLAAMGIQPNFDTDIQPFTPNGTLVPTLAIPNRADRTTAALAGKPTYNEIVYALASLITKPTPTQPDAENASTAYQWKFSPKVSDTDSPATYTTEIVSDQAFKFALGLIHTFNLTVSRNGQGGGADITGQMFGTGIEDGITATAASSVTTLDVVPMTPMQFCLYVDDSAANLGNTKLDDSFVVAFNHPQKWMPWESLDCAVSSMSDFVVQPYMPTMAITAARNSDNAGLLSDMRDGSTKFIRLEATGPVIAEIEDPGTDITNKFTLDFAGKITQPSIGETAQASTIAWTFTNVYDSTWEKPFEITVINEVASL